MCNIRRKTTEKVKSILIYHLALINKCLKVTASVVRITFRTWNSASSMTLHYTLQYSTKLPLTTRFADVIFLRLIWK